MGCDLCQSLRTVEFLEYASKCNGNSFCGKSLSWWKGIVVAYHWQNRVSCFRNDVAAEEQCLFLGKWCYPWVDLCVFSTSFSAGSPAESSVPSGCYIASEGRAVLCLSQAYSYTTPRPSGFSFMDQDFSSLPHFFLFWPWRRSPRRTWSESNAYLPLPFFPPCPRKAQTCVSHSVALIFQTATS